MKPEDRKLLTAYLLIQVENAMKESQEEFIQKRRIIQKNEDLSIAYDNGYDLAMLWSTYGEIYNDTNFTRKLGAFLEQIELHPNINIMQMNKFDIKECFWAKDKDDNYRTSCNHLFLEWQESWMFCPICGRKVSIHIPSNGTFTDSAHIHRRQRMDKWTKSEKAIYDAVQEIEMMGAEKSLTDAVNKLHEAKEIISDFVDKNIKGEGENL